MKARLEERKRAVILRRQGLSYKEIRELIPVSKGLLSTWLKGVELTSFEREFLEEKNQERIRRGRVLSHISNRTRRIERERLLIREAEQMFEERKGDPAFFSGVALYWAQGTYKSGHFQFMSSDPDMVFLMNAWIGKYLGVSQEKIGVSFFASSDAYAEGMRDFWAKNLGIEALHVKFFPYAHAAKTRKDPFYKGTVRLTVMGVRSVRLMKAWQKLSIEYYGKALLSGRET